MLEQTFAAEIMNAGRNAAIARKHGVAQAEADLVEGALSDLWACGRALGYSSEDIQTIAERHLAPREADNVVTLR